MIVAAAVAITLSAGAGAEQPRCTPWELVNPWPQANHLRDVAFGGGRWVAVGEGVAVVSTDAAAWAAVTLPGLSLNGVAYGNGAFVAVGDGGAVRAAIARSPDGMAWTHGAFPAIPARLLAVAGGRRVQLAVGAAGLTLRRECHPQSPSRRLRGTR